MKKRTTPKLTCRNTTSDIANLSSEFQSFISKKCYVQLEERFDEKEDEPATSEEPTDVVMEELFKTCNTPIITPPCSKSVSTPTTSAHVIEKKANTPIQSVMDNSNRATVKSLLRKINVIDKKLDVVLKNPFEQLQIIHSTNVKPQESKGKVDSDSSLIKEQCPEVIMEHDHKSTEQASGVAVTNGADVKNDGLSKDNTPEILVINVDQFEDGVDSNNIVGQIRNTSVGLVEPLQLEQAELSKLSSLFHLPVQDVFDCTRVANEVNKLNGYPVIAENGTKFRGSAPVHKNKIKIKIKKSQLANKTTGSKHFNTGFPISDQQRLLWSQQAPDSEVSVTKYRCTHCVSDYFSKVAILAHMTKAHSKSYKGPKCCICSVFFKSRDDHIRHNFANPLFRYETYPGPY